MKYLFALVALSAALATQSAFAMSQEEVSECTPPTSTAFAETQAIAQRVQSTFSEEKMMIIFGKIAAAAEKAQTCDEANAAIMKVTKSLVPLLNKIDAALK